MSYCLKILELIIIIGEKNFEKNNVNCSPVFI